MKAVVDTNVLISAVRGSPGAAPARTLQAIYSGSFDLLLSEQLIAELADVMTRPKHLRAIQWEIAQVEAYVQSLSALATHVHPSEQLFVFEDGPDNRLLEACMEGHADYLVSGDRAVLALGEYTGTHIVTPAQSLGILELETP